MGPQSPSLRPRRKPWGRTGNQRVRVLVVEKYWEADIGRTYRSVLAWRDAARRWATQVPSPKETVTPWDENPDDGGRQREGENGTQVSRVIQTRFSRGELTRRSQGLRGPRYGVRRLGFHARCPLNRVTETRTLGLWVKPTQASQGATTGCLHPGSECGAVADRAVWS
jgi:hypothetical protein